MENLRIRLLLGRREYEMIKKFIVLLTLMCILTSVVYASEERYSFVIDENGNTKLRYQAVFSIGCGWYIPGFKMTFNPPENASNLAFFDNYGNISPTYVGTEEGFKIYEIYTPDVVCNAPYALGYQFDLPGYTTVRSNENYFFEYPEYPLYLDFYSNYTLSICIPITADSLPVSYDSSPTGSSTNRDNCRKYAVIRQPMFVQLTNPFYKGDSSISVCPLGYKKTNNYNWDYNQKKGVYKKIISAFSVLTNEVNQFTYDSDHIKITAPSPYQTLLERNIEKVESVLPSIDTKLNLDTPKYYDIRFLSDNDAVFCDYRYGADISSVAYDDGTVYFKTSIVAVGDDEFIQVNLLRAMINSALLKTYGANSDDSWWSHGALTNMALKSMNESNLAYSEVQNTMNQVKDELKVLTTEELIELMKANDSSQILIYSSIVDEIDGVCPNHVVRLNNMSRGNSGVVFSGDRQFNNYLIYSFRNDCAKDIVKILSKYGLEYDNVLYVQEEYDKINQKYQTVATNRTDITDLNDAKDNLRKAEANLRTGQVSEALKLVEKAKDVYPRVLEIIKVYAKIESLRPKLDTIPTELRSTSILSAINKTDEAEDLLSKKNIREALAKINEASELYNKTIADMGNLQQEYIDAKRGVESVSDAFYFPAKPMAQNSLNAAVDSIKKDDFNSARDSLNNAIYWSGNAIPFSLALYMIILAGFWFGYSKLLKPKSSDSKADK